MRLIRLEYSSKFFYISWLLKFQRYYSQSCKVPEFICSFLLELADFRVLELHFPLDGADARVLSLRTVTASHVSFRFKHGVFESFLEDPMPARTLRAFSNACSSSSISLLSSAVAPASDIWKCHTDYFFKIIYHAKKEETIKKETRLLNWHYQYLEYKYL